MRVLFDLLHPAHVHLFRHLIERLRAAGEDPVVLARHKDVTAQLLASYGIPHRVVSRSGSGLARGSVELARRTWEVLRAARQARSQVLLGTSMSIGLVGRLLRVPSFVFNEDDREAVPLFAKTAYPLARWIVTPRCLERESYGARHLTYPGYHELAYLHPDHFTPDPRVPQALGLTPEEPYFVLRLVALKAHHDTAESGISRAAARELVETLSAQGRVLITAEGELHEEFREYQFPLGPETMHDVLAFAALYIGDSQTMAAEAAVLGVPSLRCNTFIGRIEYLTELEERYDLTRGFRPEAFPALLELVRSWLPELEMVRAGYRARRERMLGECVDLAEWQWRMLQERAG